MESKNSTYTLQGTFCTQYETYNNYFLYKQREQTQKTIIKMLENFQTYEPYLKLVKYENDQFISSEEDKKKNKNFEEFLSKIKFYIKSNNNFNNASFQQIFIEIDIINSKQLLEYAYYYTRNPVEVNIEEQDVIFEFFYIEENNDTFKILFIPTLRQIGEKQSTGLFKTIENSTDDLWSKANKTRVLIANKTHIHKLPGDVLYSQDNPCRNICDITFMDCLRQNDNFLMGAYGKIKDIFEKHIRIFQNNELKVYQNEEILSFKEINDTTIQINDETFDKEFFLKTLTKIIQDKHNFIQINTRLNGVFYIKQDETNPKVTEIYVSIYQNNPNDNQIIKKQNLKFRHETHKLYISCYDFLQNKISEINKTI